MDIKKLIQTICKFYDYAYRYDKEHNVLIVDGGNEPIYRGYSDRKDYHFEYTSEIEMLRDWLSTLETTDNEECMPFWEKEIIFIKSLSE